jgi:hypothetical protein
MTVNRSLIFLIAAIVRFVVALLLTLAVISGGSEHAWEVGGFLALALSFLP